MKNILKISYYELKRLLRDWRLTLIVLSQPIAIAIIVSLVANHLPSNINIGIVDQSKSTYSSLLAEKILQSTDLKATIYPAVDDNKIKNGELRGFVVINIPASDPSAGEVTLLNDSSGQYIKLIVQPGVMQAVADVSKLISQNSLQSALPQIKITEKKLSPLDFSARDLTNVKTKFSDYYGSGMMVLLILLVVVNLSGMSVTSERVNGTFERLFVTPYTKMEVMLGKALAFFVIGTIIALLGNLTLVLLFDAVIANISLTIIINLLVVATSVTLGLLVSSITYTVVESVQLSMYLFFISVLSTSIFSPIETANKYFAYFIKIVPFYYAVTALRHINMSGANFAQVATNIYILIGAFLLFLVLSIVLLRREST